MVQQHLLFVLFFLCCSGFKLQEIFCFVYHHLPFVTAISYHHARRTPLSGNQDHAIRFSSIQRARFLFPLFLLQFCLFVPLAPTRLKASKTWENFSKVVRESNSSYSAFSGTRRQQVSSCYSICSAPIHVNVQGLV